MNLYSRKVLLILFVINWLSVKPIANKFCDENREKITSIFTMEDMTFILFDTDYYQKNINETFADKTSIPIKNLKTPFETINTGFYFPPAEACSQRLNSGDKCQIESLLTVIAFIIGQNNSDMNQSYISHTLVDGQLTPSDADLTNKDYHFVMKNTAFIDQQMEPKNNSLNIFPKRGKNFTYLAAFYDKNKSSLVYLIEDKGELLNQLYIIPLANLADHSHVYPMNSTKYGNYSFKGFFQSYTNERKTFALIVSNGEKKVFEYFGIPKGNKVVDPFGLENDFDLEKDLFGCTGQTTDDTTEVESTSPEVLPSTDKGISNELTVLFWVFVMVSIIGSVLFIAVLSLVLYIYFKRRRIEARRNPKTKGP